MWTSYDVPKKFSKFPFGVPSSLRESPGSRDDVLEPSVYDLARESARVEGRAGSRGKERLDLSLVIPNQ